MARIGKEPRRIYGTANLIPQDVIVVTVASFTFRFDSAEKLRDCLSYYETKTRPSSRIPAKVIASQLGKGWRQLRSWEVERWFERLPMYLLEEPKRKKVVKALSEALALMEAGKI